MESRALEPIWSPPPDRAATTNLARFCEAVGRHDYQDLHRWSVADPGSFWRAAWENLGVVGEPGETVFVPADELPDARFFPEARLNVAENLLGRDDDTPALVFRGEDPDLRPEVTRRQMTWYELRLLVGRIQEAFRADGLRPGDVVAAWLPNIPETYAVMLAAAASGLVFTSTSPDFGVDGAVDRFGQTRPRILFGCDAYAYAGRIHDRLGVLAEARRRLDSVERVVVVPFLGDGGTGEIADAVSLEDWLAGHGPRQPDFERFPFDHPWYVLYSSGTTGKPKCIVHRAGGVLLKHLVEHQLHCDVRPGDRVFYFTTAGWMMWNWLASGLASDATLVLYDGSPFHPDAARLFDLAADTRITLFGTSAKFIEAVAKRGLRPATTHDLSSVRTITSTGSPLVAEGFETVYRDISPDVHLASISGGTDLCGCLVAGDPTSPVWPGEIQRPGLGLDIDVVDDEGRSLPPGRRGELVCRNPFPSMPLGFWGDPDGSRYRAAYFERFPGMWHQGDFAEWTEHGGIIIHGRSDATLNPGGVRIGTAEIYRQVDKVPEVLEAIVVGQDVESDAGRDVRIVLFVVLRDGVELTDELAQRIRRTIRDGCTPRHVPAVIGQVPDIPRTRSGKIVELAVREVIHGRPVKNVEALANPEALEYFRDHPALAGDAGP
ncbi:MAG: acetoacetate--CoA ligase [Actinomyces sp.]|nr:MAG: acetoacetate--CoA ligase [Actinomyces sp.]